jgi:hypothetical protein
MPKSTVASSSESAPFRERRKNMRLRALIDELRDGIRANKRELAVQFERFAQLQAELDIVKAVGRK